MANINIRVENGQNSLSSTYKTVVLKGNVTGQKNVLTQAMLADESTKYVIRWDFDLDNKSITVPSNCIIEFDGGSLSNGTLVGQDTILEGNFYGNVVLSGTFENKTLSSMSADIDELKEAIGTGGSVDEKIQEATDAIKGNVDEEFDTLEKIENKVVAINVEIGRNDVPQTIKGRVKRLEDAVGDGGSIDVRIQSNIENAVNSLDAEAEQSAGSDGLSLHITEVDGKVVSVSGSIAPETYDAFGSAANAKSEVIGDASTDYNTLGKIEDKVQEKADSDNVYTKSETYSKAEVNSLVTTPNVNYVTVSATDQTTDVSDLLPAIGASDTIYRVGNWDGTQYDESNYSEYSWDGLEYILLSVKEVGIDNEPTAGSNNLVKSGGVLAKCLQDMLNWDNTIILSTDEQNSGWLPLPTPIKKDIFVFATDVDPNNTMAIAMSGDGGTTIAFQLNITKTQRYITIPQGVESSLTHWRLWSSAAVKKTVKIGYIDNFQELVFSRLMENLNVENTYQDGYWDDNATWVSGGGWRSFTFNTVQGHNYLIYCATGTNIVDIDSNAVASINIGGVTSAKGAINLGYRIAKANGVKLGASLRTSISKMYYIDLDTYSGTSLPREILRIISNTDAALVTRLNKLNIKNDCDNTITSFSDVLNGYAYNEDGELIQAGGWHVAFIDVVVDRYYLIKTCNANTIRIVNVDANKDFVSINGSVPISWYQGSASTESYVFVRASSAKLAITYHNNSSDVRVTPITDNSPYIALVNTINNTSGSPEYIVDINGGGDFTSFMECLLTTNYEQDRTIILKSGEYDVITELKAIYGNSYFDNFVHTALSLGPELKNNVTIIGCPNAVIKCHYTGTNIEVNKWFSPLNAIIDSFRLVGVNIDAKNVRYCVHDEHQSRTNVYRSSYIGCDFKLDNSENPNWHEHHCIGMGLGVNGNITIKDCVFETVGTTGNTGAVYVHNSAAANAKNNVVIKDCYVKGTNSIKLHYYGSSTLISDFLVSNNNLGDDIEVGAETSESTNVNINVLSWNNVIRS